MFQIVSMLSGSWLARAELKTNEEMSRKNMMEAVADGNVSSVMKSDVGSEV